ncbi:TIGR03617 family F420-dependent LLM class oxidoreductase [Anaerolineae bacterium CFX7]|nr:TIGR03617 family F420-dependent LLM class oxidoreductase [Anaerolineae bacterium CFX7]
MKIDAATLVPNLGEMPALARSVEALGFDCLWTSETQHDPFLPLALAAEHTKEIELGTAIAVAFPRSPTVLAHIAWDLQAASKGRFILGLGTQVKPHIERRFGMTWEHPTAKLREMILAMRAVWDAWQGDGRINFRGEFYKITLMTPFFNPGPIEHPHIPIYIAGVNEKLCQLAGELCQGFHVHPFHSAKYLREVTLPNIAIGMQKTQRQRADLQVSSAVFVATDDAEKEMVRAQISFYASTPSYRAVLETHGWSAVGEELSMMAARKEWAEMASKITDEMLEEFCVVATPDKLTDAIKARYTGLLDRITLYTPFEPDQDTEKWKALIKAFKQ